MITIYTMNGCVWCDRAKGLAEQYALPFVIKNISNNPEHLTELREEVGNVKTVPQIIWNGRHIGGYTEFASEIEQTIGGHGEGPC